MGRGSSSGSSGSSGGRSSSSSGGRGSSSRSLGGSSRGNRSSSSGGGGFSGGYSGGNNYNNGGRYHPRYNNYGPGGNYYGSGGHRSNGVLSIVVIIFVLFVFLAPFLLRSGNITASSINRKPLPAGSALQTNYFEDTTGSFVQSQSKMENGMKYFFNKTGVQPFIYITDSINGNQTPSEAEKNEFGNKLYDELFKDESHLLIIYFHRDSMDDDVFCLVGNKAEIVIDQEARDILLDYFEAHYFDDSMDNSEYVSTVFKDTAQRIMKVTLPVWVPVIIVVISLAVVVVLFSWWKAHKKQQNVEAEHTEKILQTDVEEIGRDSVDDLADKYK